MYQLHITQRLKSIQTYRRVADAILRGRGRSVEPRAISTAPGGTSLLVMQEPGVSAFADGMVGMPPHLAALRAADASAR